MFLQSYRATVQALASIAEIVEEIVKIQPLGLQDSALRIITYIQRYLPYIARGSHTPNDVLQWEEIRVEGRRTRQSSEVPKHVGTFSIGN